MKSILNKNLRKNVIEVLITNDLSFMRFDHRYDLLNLIERWSYKGMTGYTQYTDNKLLKNLRDLSSDYDEFEEEDIENDEFAKKVISLLREVEGEIAVHNMLTKQEKKKKKEKMKRNRPTGRLRLPPNKRHKSKKDYKRNNKVKPNEVEI